MLSTIDDFLKIFRFYRNNPLTTLRERFKENSIIYEDSVDVFLNSINWSSSEYDSSTTLTYPEDETIVQTAINAREDLSVLFDKVLFPGSYAFVTQDNALFKTLLLDWASSIKTIQDSAQRVTNAYSLTSEDTDKAIRGFGVDFINEYSVPSLSRRQTFLLSMCELYKIKGTPASIIQALDIVGMKNVYIREAWVVPARNGREDIEIEWRQVKQNQVFNNINNSYDDPYTAENTYMDWGWFDEKIHVFIGEPHWFYTKEEIVNLNWARYKWDETDSGETLTKIEDVWMKLPSITPYFSIEFYTDADKQNAAFGALAKALNNQYQQYLNGEFDSIPKNLNYGSYPNRISALQCYCALIYSFIQLDNYVRYNSLRIYLDDLDIDSPTDFSLTENRFLELIYWLYLKRKNATTTREYNLYNSAINNYVQPKDNGYCSYDEVLYWWINKEYGSDEDIQQNPLPKTIIQPTGGKIVDDNNEHCQLFWEEKYPYGYYDIEVYSKFAGWQTLYSNLSVNSIHMQIVVPLDNNGAYADSSDVSNFRIVHYRTEANIPDIFFGNPFYFDPVAKPTDMNRIQFYNYIDSTPDYYNNNVLKLIFQRESIIPTQDSTQSEEDLNSLKADVEYNLYKKLYETKVRLTDTDTQYRSYQSGLFNYPQGILKEDKDIQIASSMFEYVSWVADNYTDTITHDGSNVWYYHMSKKWPLNKRWNWSASGNLKDSEDKNHGYYLWNYESCKWCRCKTKISSYISVPEESDYGVPWYDGKSIHIKVSDSKEMIIDSDTTYIQDEWNALRWIETEETFNSEEDRNNRVDFLENLNIHCTKYEVLNDDKSVSSYNLKFLLPPSDLYPTDALKTYSFTGLDYSSEFCDTVFKPDSVLARQMVTDSMSVDKAQQIYEDVAAIKSSGDKSLSEVLNSERIDVIHDPFYLKDSVQYTYNDLLNYIYLNRLTIDIASGYLYRSFDFYLDQYGFMYIKCRINNHNGDISTKWVRFKIQMTWDKNEERGTIYDENSTLGTILPTLGFLKRYDAQRLLDGPVFKSTELNTAAEVFQQELDKGNVPSSTNLVLLLDKNNGVDDKFFTIKVKRSKLVFNNEKTEYEIVDDWVDEDKLTDINGNVIENLPSRIFDVNFGICEDILDYINSLYETDDENYVEVPQNLMQTLTDFLQQELGWEDVNLDFNISYLTSNKVVRQIIKFYKPKRARLLYLSMNIEGSVFNDIYSGISTGDSNYNHYDLNNWLWNMPRYNTHERKKSNVTRIAQQINDYVPIDDLHYSGNNALVGEIWNGREFYENNDEAPTVECYDRITKLTDNVITLRDQNISASFYTNYYDHDDVDGFYFRIPGSREDSAYNTYTYTNNNFYFIRARFQYRTDELKVLNRWFVYSVYANTQDLYSCLYMSEEDISEYPWQNSSGGEIKYIKFDSSWNSRQLDENVTNSSNYKYGIFQTSDNIKINYRKLEPSAYFNCFIDDRFNGWYYYDYIDGKKKNGQITYFNTKGKIISYLDYSYLSDSYIEPLVNEYYKEYSNKPVNKFWIISDDKQVVDFSDASYIAYETSSSPSIFDYDADGNLTGTTKKFYKINPKIVGYNNEPELLSEYYGYHISTVLDDFGLVNRKDKIHHRLSDPMSFVNILIRRTPINTVPVRFEPISFINFNYNAFMDDYFFEEEYNSLIESNDIHKTRIECSNDINDRSSFVMNEIGYNLGAFHLKDGYISFDSNERVRINRVSDSKKYFTTFVRFKLVNENKKSFENSTVYFVNYDFEVGKWYSLSINQNCEKNNNNQWNYSRDIFVNGKLIETQEAYELLSTFTFSDVDIVISEYAVFASQEEKLPDWYQPIIHKYRVLRERPEPNKTFDSIGPRNWRPIFAIYEPRTIFGRWCTGIPEITQGDRVRSLKYNQEKKQWEYYPYSTTTSVDGGELTDRDEYGDPWNIDSYYNPDWPQDFNDLWLKKHQNTIYDRKISFRTRKMNYEDGKTGDVVIGFSVERRDYSDLLIKNSCTLYPHRDSINFNNGLQYSVPSNYVAGFDVPTWWVREPEKFRTGAIHHRPLYIAIQERKEDPWPDIPINEDCGDYFDDRLIFDGKSNIDNSLYDPNKGFSSDIPCWWYNENLFDNVTKYSIIYQQNLLDKKKCFVIDQYGLESEIDCPLEDDGDLSWNESLSEEEPEIIEKIVKITKDGNEAPQYKGIEDIRNNADTYCQVCNGNTNYIQDLDQLDLTEDQIRSGFYHRTIYCNSFGEELKYLNGKWILRNNAESKQDGDFNYCYYHEDSNSELVSTYQKNSGYYWWEIRTLIDNQWVKLARTFVKPKINLSQVMIEYDYINELQRDVCGQKLCSFNLEDDVIQDYKQFEKLPYPNVQQKVINEKGFYCNKWINIDIKPSTNFNIPGVIDNFVTERKLYLYYNNRWWYIPCELKWNDDELITPETKESTPSGFAYRNGYLYVYVHSDEPEKYEYYLDEFSYKIKEQSKIYTASSNNKLYWIRIKVDEVSGNYVSECVYPWTIIYRNHGNEVSDIVLATDIKSNVDPFGGLGENFVGWAKSTKLSYILKTLIQIPVTNEDEHTGFCMNVLDASYATIFEDTYICTDTIDIRGSIYKLLKYNNKPPYYNQEGKEWVYQKQPDQIVGLRKETFKDYVDIYMFYHCAVDVRCFDPDYVGVVCSGDTALCDVLNYKEQWFVMMETPWGEIKFMSTWRREDFPKSFYDLYNCYIPKSPVIQPDGSVVYKSWRIVYNPFNKDYRYDPTREEKYVFKVDVLAKEYWKTSYNPPCPTCYPPSESESESHHPPYVKPSESESESYLIPESESESYLESISFIESESISVSESESISVSESESNFCWWEFHEWDDSFSDSFSESFSESYSEISLSFSESYSMESFSESESESYSDESESESQSIKHDSESIIIGDISSGEYESEKVYISGESGEIEISGEDESVFIESGKFSKILVEQSVLQDTQDPFDDNAGCSGEIKCQITDETKIPLFDWEIIVNDVYITSNGTRYDTFRDVTVNDYYSNDEFGLNVEFYPGPRSPNKGTIVIEYKLRNKNTGKETETERLSADINIIPFE